MGIELSPASSAGPPEATAPAKAPRTNEPAVSEWTSILGFMFQIEQPVEGESDASVNSDIQTSSNIFSSPEGAHFWAGFLAHASVVVSGETAETTESSEAETVASTGDVHGNKIEEQTLATGEGLELSAADWTILSTAIPMPQQYAPPVASNSSTVAPEHAAAASPSSSSQTQIAEGAPVAHMPSGPVDVEAVFQLQMTAPVSTNLDTSHQLPMEETMATLEPEFSSGQATMPEQRALEGPGDHPDGRANSSNSESDHPGRDDDPRGNGGDPAPENQHSATTREQPFFAERGHTSIPNNSHTLLNGSQSTAESISPKEFRQSIEESLNSAISEKRASPLQFQLRISPDDFGTQTVGNGGEVRLNLLQRGDEILMKIQGGGEPLVVRAESEWEGLVERLKPHGLEAASTTFSREGGRRDSEPWTPSLPEQAMPDSAANPGDEQRRFNQEQQQHQQRKQRQRFSTKSGPDTTPFLLDYRPLSPH